jgi:hypothetical protein
MLLITDPLTAIDLENAFAAKVAESVYAELILDINPSELQGTSFLVDIDGNYHLVHHGFNTHDPYLARHCRRNMVGSLQRGIPMMVD